MWIKSVSEFPSEANWGECRCFREIFPFDRLIRLAEAYWKLQYGWIRVDQVHFACKKRSKCYYGLLSSANNNSREWRKLIHTYQMLQEWRNNCLLENKILRTTSDYSSNFCSLLFGGLSARGGYILHGNCTSSPSSSPSVAGNGRMS